jgi:hypothetical protein
MIVTAAPNVTLFKIIGLFELSPLLPKGVRCLNEKLEPIYLAFNMVEYGCANNIPPTIFVVLDIIKERHPGLYHSINREVILPIL